MALFLSNQQYALLLIVISAATLLLDIAVSRRAESQAARFFSWMLRLMNLWMLGSAFEALSPNFASKFFWLRFKYFGVTLLPVVWFLFVWAYTRTVETLRRRFALLLVVPISTLLLIWTNGTAGLFWPSVSFQPLGSESYVLTTHGWWFTYIHTPYSYGLLLLGVIMLVRALWSHGGLTVKQVAAMLLAALIPLLTNVFYVFITDILSAEDPTPLTFALSILLLGWALFRGNLFEVAPIAYRTVLKHVSEGIMILDARQRVVEVNGVMAGRLGRSAQELIGKSTAELFAAYPNLLAQFSLAEPEVLDLEMANKICEVNLSTLKQSGSTPVGWVMMSRDITESKRREAKLTQLSLFDPLTEVLNRRGLEFRANQMLSLAKREAWSMALIYLDLDDFKSVNDRLGHAAGDQLLKRVAFILKEQMREADAVARLGGDEFVVLMSHTDAAKVAGVCSRIVLSLEQEKQSYPADLKVSASIGVAIYPQHGEVLKLLLNNADKAMYNAKDTSSSFRIYKESSSKNTGTDKTL